MPAFSSMVAPAKRSLAAHLGRLCDTLDGLAGQVREAIARAVSRTVAEAVREAVQVVLDGPPDVPTRSHHPPAFWGDPYARGWPDDSDNPRSPSYSQYAEEGWPGEEEPDDDFRDRVRPVNPPRESAWRRAVATGCQAAGWWLRRHPGRFSVLAAVGVGVAAGVVAVAKGSVAVGGLGVAASALSLIALADATRKGIAALAEAVTF